MWIHATLATAMLAAPVAQHQHGPAEKLGTVKFSTSCSSAAQPSFARAMALLHSFEFGQAIDAFDAAATADTGCAIAYWGIAVSHWGNPFAPGIKPVSALKAGRAAAGKAKEIGAKTERERAFIDAAARLYADFETVNQRTRALAYRDAMKQVAASNPQDAEAAAFYALALASSQDPADMTYASLLEAATILEKLAPAQPDHPGFAHYLIHAYDAPPLASRGLASARRYAKIAPSAPHALHMPSHTFTRLGYWQESIDTNIASADAARRAKSPYEELHAMDYQMYAYMQLAQDAAAKRLLDGLPGARERFNGPATAGASPPMGGAYAVAAIPARYALERGAWADAARLEVATSPFANAEAVSWFAKGLGAARTKDLEGARAAVAALEQLRAKLEKAGEAYWTEQVKIQHLAASAWLALADDRTDEALTLLREAADREDRTEKAPVTPGPIAPAREQVGEMLLLTKQPALALTAFETTLKKEPNRYRALAGAAEAARQAGNSAAARSTRKRSSILPRTPMVLPAPKSPRLADDEMTGTVKRDSQTGQPRLSVPALFAAALVVGGLAAPSGEQKTSTDTAVKAVLESVPFRQASASIDKDYDRFVRELIALTEIPSPPFKEQARAKTFLEMLRKEGLADVEMDAEGNAMGVRKGTAAGQMLAVLAHLDTVFPEGTDVKVKRQGTRLMAPGIGDNTRGAALMLAVIRAMNAGKFQTPADVLFVGNVGEEGEGDLRGVKFLMQKGKYKDRIKQFIAIDATEQSVVTHRGVGSVRYRVAFHGPGGHSYSAFGLVNPAFAMGNAIAKVSRLQPPAQPKTTFNVGVVGGGTSINAIPVHVQMDVDLRSESCAELKKLNESFLAVVKQAVDEENAARSTTEGRIAADPKLIGERPCGETPLTSRLVQIASSVIRAFGLKPSHETSSTDANVPMNMGIPAITIGRGGPGGRTHSLDEWSDVERNSAVQAIRIAMVTIVAAAR